MFHAFKQNVLPFLAILLALTSMFGCSAAQLFSGASSAAEENAKSMLSGEDEGTRSHKVYAEDGKGLFQDTHLASYELLYEPLQVVFARTEEDSNSNQGPYLTYLELLKQATALGGHDIVNVRIERTENCVKTKKKEPECKNVRFGSALAIRYLKPVMQGELVDKGDHYYYKPLEKGQERGASVPAPKEITPVASEKSE